jgi:glycosyltransferase involved in cell wall biosynthesis
MSETPTLTSLSVIIPAYNRERVLAKALDAYLEQSSPHLIHELLVVDDGSTDGTEAMVRDFSCRSPFPIRYFRQSNKGPAAARNLGIREAASDIVLFTDSDIVPQRDLVEQHLEWHVLHPQMSAAVLGYVTWLPEIKATPFMRWYGEEGALFAYRQLRGKCEIDFRFLYTCNLSLKTNFLRACGMFDEDFKSAAWEDTELGYRLHTGGLRLFYNSRAIAFHDQYFTFEEACRKALANSAARETFFKKQAGQYFLTQHKQQARRMRARLSRFVAMGVAAIVGPSNRFLDSGIPLPSSIYRALYWYRVNRQWEQMESSDGQL